MPEDKLSDEVENICNTIDWIKEQDEKLMIIQKERRLTEDEKNSIHYLLGKLAVERRNINRLLEG